MSFFSNALHLLAPLTANCRDFHARWDAAKPLGSEGISGCWEGEWVSSVSGHSGRLLCVIDPVAPALWRMHFRGEYAKVFRACYSTDVNVVQEAGRWTFKARSNLGAFGGGPYESAGYATLQEILASYRSKLDEGTFRLRRRQRATDPADSPR